MAAGHGHRPAAQAAAAAINHRPAKGLL
jgi:hypothetical protein